MNHRQLIGETIRESFIKYHRKHPEVYRKFENMALGAIRKGRKKLSAKLIINVIRWEYYFNSEEDFKINDAYHSYYARLFVAIHPKYSNYFAFRKLRNEEAAPYMEIGVNGQIKFL